MLKAGAVQLAAWRAGWAVGGWVDRWAWRQLKERLHSSWAVSALRQWHTRVGMALAQTAGTRCHAPACNTPKPNSQAGEQRRQAGHCWHDVGHSPILHSQALQLPQRGQCSHIMPSDVAPPPQLPQAAQGCQRIC